VETPREALRNRRNAYLARVSIFDSVEADPRVDRRPARSRRCFAGGDDIPDRCRPDSGERPVHRPPAATDRAEQARALRRQQARTNEADWDQFIAPPGAGGGMSLYRITAVLLRAVELIRQGVPLAPAAVLDVMVTRLPGPDETDRSLSKAWALLKLAGYDWNELNSVIAPALDGAPWDIDEYSHEFVPYGDGQLAPKFTSLRDSVVLTVWRQLDAYLSGYPPFTDTRSTAQRPAPAPGSPPARAKDGTGCACWPGIDPATGSPVPAPVPLVPSLLVSDEVAQPVLHDAVLAALGTVSVAELVELLRRLTVEEPVVARLLHFVHTCWQQVPEDWRWYVGTIQYQQAPSTPQPPDRSPPDEDAFAEVARSWHQLVVLLQTLVFLGNCTKNPVREVCVRLAMLVWEQRQPPGSSGIFLLDAARFEDPGHAQLAGIRQLGQYDDYPFRLALFQYTDKKLRMEVFQRALAGNLRAYPPGRSGPLADRFSSAAPDPVSALYWRNVVLDGTFGHLLSLVDTADFALAEHLRFLGHFRPGGRSRPRRGEPGFDERVEAFLSSAAPDWFLDFATAAILRFKFWLTDAPTPNSGNVEMTFWSENHQVLFACGEYLAGQFWPDETFTHAVDRAGRTLTGREHRDRARVRLEKWLLDRLRFGFAEVNSAVYYNEHLPAVFNAVDFVDDPRLRTLATMVLDLLVFDVARHSCQGSFIAATNRVYIGNKASGWAASVSDFVEVLTGTAGDVGGPGEDAAICLATSSYLDSVPEVLLAIAAAGTNPAAAPGTSPAAPSGGGAVPVVARSRSSIGFGDAGRYGIGTDGSEDIVFWWSHSAYFTEETYRASQSWSYRWNLRSTPPFALFDKIDWAAIRLVSAVVEAVETSAVTGVLLAVHPLLALVMVGRLVRVLFDLVSSVLDLGVAAVTSVLKEIHVLDEDDDRVRLAKPLVEQEFERLAIQLNAGSVIERAHVYLWRSADAQLSSLVDEKKGQFSAQKEVCIANLGPSVSVFVSKPLEPEGAGATLLDAVAGLATGAAGMFEVWETYPPVVDAGDGSAMPEISRPAGPVAVNAASGDIFGDGPGFFHGQASNPLVWQQDNVAIAIFRTSQLQRSVSNRTHAYWPWEHFDEVRTEERAGGRWVFGRRDRRFPPRTPCQPYAVFPSGEIRNRWPSEQTPWPSGPAGPEAGPGAGYVALFSAKGLKTTPAIVDDDGWLNAREGQGALPATAGWGHRELIADGHDNIWVTVVGDRATYGSFDEFCADVLAVEPRFSVADGWCTVVTPVPGAAKGTKGRTFEVNFDHGAKVDGTPLSTSDWPRFELVPSALAGPGARLPYRVDSTARPGRGRVDFDETGWRIEARVLQVTDGEPGSFTLFLVHDLRDPANPVRRTNTKPPDTPRPAASARPDRTEVELTSRRSLLGAEFRPHRHRPTGPRPRSLP
jgi:hypothetical protein